jgi:hypothetical protein
MDTVPIGKQRPMFRKKLLPPSSNRKYLLDCLDPKDGSRKLLRKFGTSFLNYMVSHLGRLNPYTIGYVLFPSFYTKFLTYTAVSISSLATHILYTLGDPYKGHLFPVI